MSDRRFISGPDISLLTACNDSQCGGIDDVVLVEVEMEWMAELKYGAV